MSKKNNYYYKKNQVKKNYYKKEKNNGKVENKITYDQLIHANTITKEEKKDIDGKTLIIKYVAITVVLFAIILGSLLLFRQL